MGAVVVHCGWWIQLLKQDVRLLPVWHSRNNKERCVCNAIVARSNMLVLEAADHKWIASDENCEIFVTCLRLDT